MLSLFCVIFLSGCSKAALEILNDGKFNTVTYVDELAIWGGSGEPTSISPAEALDVLSCRELKALKT